MKARIYNLWRRLMSSLWFIPGLMVAVAIGLWYAMSTVDTFLGEEGITLWWVSFGDVEGSRAILAAIAGSIITVAGVVFSITIVVLSNSAGQFGPQLVKNFMQDKSTQLTLGIFSGTFIYSLFMLGSLRGISGDSLPQAGTALALFLALASIVVLIDFIHNMARSIQSNRMIASVVGELNNSIERALPKNRDGSRPDEDKSDAAALPADFMQVAMPIVTSKNGFLQSVQVNKLLKTAIEEDLVLALTHLPGDFVTWRGELALAWPRERLEKRVQDRIRGAFLIGDERTTEQDVRFSIERLAMVASRALSPSLNDPYTANICIDWLGTSLCRLAEHGVPGSFHFDEEGGLRIVTPVLNLRALLDTAFLQIRHSADSPLVFSTLLSTIAHISVCVTQPEDRNAVMYHLRAIRNDIYTKFSGNDLALLRGAYLAAIAEFNRVV